MKRIMVLAFCAIFVLSSVCSVSAAVLDHWTYSITGSFSHSKFTKGKNGARKIGTDYLQWGDPSFKWIKENVSSLKINTGSGSSNTNSATALWHENNAINSKYKSLSSGSLSLSIDLESFNGVSLNLTPFTFSLDFTFNETLNSLSEPNDIWIITSTIPETQLAEFSFDGLDYDLTMDLKLEQFFYNNDYFYGFSTPENSNSTLNFEWAATPPFRSTVIDPPAPTPEPATMLLMGVGLAGLGFAKRRKQNNA